MIGVRGVGRSLGGWGYFIGLKGGSPVTSDSTPAVTTSVTAALVTVASTGTSVSTTTASSAGLETGAQPPVSASPSAPHQETDTSTSSVIINRVSSQSAEATTTVSLSTNMSVNTNTSQAEQVNKPATPSSENQAGCLILHKIPPSLLYFEGKLNSDSLWRLLELEQIYYLVLLGVLLNCASPS